MAELAIGGQNRCGKGTRARRWEDASGRFRTHPPPPNYVRHPTPNLSCSTRTKIRSIGTSWLCGGRRQDKTVPRSSPPGPRQLFPLPFVSCRGSLNQNSGDFHFRRCDPGQYRSRYRRHGYSCQPRPFNRTPAARCC